MGFHHKRKIEREEQLICGMAYLFVLDLELRNTERELLRVFHSILTGLSSLVLGSRSCRIRRHSKALPCVPDSDSLVGGEFVCERDLSSTQELLDLSIGQIGNRLGHAGWLMW